MLVNLDKCVGCFSCQVSCKAEYKLPFGIFRCKVKTYRSGDYPHISKLFLPYLCNHCDNAPCIETCEKKALIKNQDGIVLVNRDKCIGCQMCIEKCPYNAIETNPGSGQPEKCDFCYDLRVTKGLLPVCVQNCMGKAILFGDINDKQSEISAAMNDKKIKVLKPELSTNPSVFYLYKGEITHTPLNNYKAAHANPTIRTSIDLAVTEPETTARQVYSSDAMCPSECGISVRVEDGVAKQIYGNPHSLINNGTLCAKGASGLQLTYSPLRIKTPLKRTGRRGEDKWEAITWEEASEYMAEKLIEIKQKYGPEAVFLDCGDVTDREAYYRLFHAFGTPNTYNHGSICDPNRRWGHRLMMGDERPLPDIQRPVLMRNEEGDTFLNMKQDIKLLLNIGANPLVATRFNYMSCGIPAAREENDCIYVVVDPAHTNSAARADMWLPIIPGTDAALLAAMFYFIVTHDSPSDASKSYIDHAFLKKHSIGWEEFRSTFLRQAEKTDPSNELRFFSLEWAENKTGISVDNIKKISRLFGITKPAAIEIGMHGTAHHTNGDVTSILMTALCLITGNADRPGGLVFVDSAKPKRGKRTSGKAFLDKVVNRMINGAEVSGKLSELNKDAFGDYPAAWKGVLTDLPGKIREGIKLKFGPFRDYSYPVKAFVTRAGNPVITAGNTSDWKDALTAEDKNGNYLLDLMVFIDTHITETGKYADIVFPEAGFLERMGVSDVYTFSPEISIRDQVIKPLHESKTPYEFMISISEALIHNGDPDIRAEDFKLNYETEEEFVDEILSEAPGFYNMGTPLPYPSLPEGCLISGVPDNPTAMWGDKTIRTGEDITVEWLRKNNGVAVWPASYYRYRNSSGSPSKVYPHTPSGMFEFKFGYLVNMNETFGTDFPETFYWSDCKWNPSNPEYKGNAKEFPFQLISGRVHHAMTMTAVCPYLAETDTECMERMNSSFQYDVPELGNLSIEYGLQDSKCISFHADSVSIPVFAVNRADAAREHLKTGDIVILETPLKKRIKGKVLTSDEIMPGVIKTAFGPGGQKASGTGFMSHTAEYTPNINELHDPDNICPRTGMPGFGDILVRIITRNNS